MDTKLVEEINQLVLDYHESNNPRLLDEIQIRLKHLEYQSWLLKYKLKIIENPNSREIQERFSRYEKLFGHYNAYTKYHLIIPLMLYLLVHHKENKPALGTSLSFMNDCKEFLKEGDFAKTKTGVQRFITNTRFASLELRRFGLLRSDDKHYYHTWELSLFGILIAGSIYFDYRYLMRDYLFKEVTHKDKAYQFFLEVLNKYTKQLYERDKIRKILESILDDSVISEFLGLYEKRFLEFAKKIELVTNNGFKPAGGYTRELINMLNSINADREITKLADSIILKKDIEVNMKDIFNIINPKKNE